MLHRLSPRKWGFVLVILAALAVSACSSGSAAVAAGGGSGQLTIGFASPADGAQVTIPFDVQLDSSVPLGEPSTGDHHAHLYFDSGTDAADYDIVYGTSAQVTRRLSPGPHTITVAMANADHSLAGPTQTITVVVGGGGGSGGSGVGASPAAPYRAAPSQGIRPAY